MYVQNDYLMRLIGELIRAAAKIAFGKTVQWNLYRDQVSGIPEGRWEQYEALMRMVDAGEINEAENILTDQLEPGDPEYLQIALMFYDRLNQESDEFLENHDFSKQEVLDEAFRQALEEMCSLPEEQYIQLLARLAVQASSTGREQLIFSPKDRTRIGKAVVMAANDALVKQVAPELPDAITDSKVGAFLGKVVNSAAAQITGTGLLTLSEETRPIRGGFIMVDGPVEVNCAFEAMVRAQREQLEKPVAEILFQK